MCEIFLLQNVQTSSGAHSASYTMLPAFFPPGVNRSGCAVSPSPSHSFPFPRLQWRGKGKLYHLPFTDIRNEELPSQRLDYKLFSTCVITLSYEVLVIEILISYRERDWKNTSHCALCGPQTVTLKCGHGNWCFKTRGTCGPPILDGLQRKRNHETSYCQRNLLFH